MSAPGRVVAVDLGEARVGVAVSDSNRRLASPYEVLHRSGDRAADRAAIARIVDEVGATTLVVGIPLGLDGRRGRAAAAALEEIARLRDEVGDRLGVDVVGVDERLSTVEADRRRVEALKVRDRARRQGRGGRAGRTGAGRRGRAVVDDAAAAVFLQSFLDAGGRAAPSEPPGSGGGAGGSGGEARGNGGSGGRAGGTAEPGTGAQR